MNKTSSGRKLLGGLALLATIWGVLGWFDLESAAEAGFDTDTQQRVIQVQPGSPAAGAGLLPGDQLVKVAGYAAEDVRSLSRLPRMKAGDTRQFTILREGVEQEINIRYTALSAANLARERAAAIIGF